MTPRTGCRVGLRSPNIEVKRVIKLLKIPNIINELLRGVEEDLESKYNSNTIIINMLNRSRSI